VRARAGFFFFNRPPSAAQFLFPDVLPSLPRRLKEGHIPHTFWITFLPFQLVFDSFDQSFVQNFAR